MQATPDPITSITWQTWVELNPRVARDMGLVEGDVVAVETPQGRIEVPVFIHPAAPPTVLAVPLGQGHTSYGRWAEKRGVNPLDILAPSSDQTTGAFAYGSTRARLVKTGRHMPVSKYQGTADAEQLDEVKVLQVTREA
jgi:molybdopterin-containing oxidoreductase family iron-sulfur binding subunit